MGDKMPTTNAHPQRKPEHLCLTCKPALTAAIPVAPGEGSLIGEEQHTGVSFLAQLPRCPIAPQDNHGSVGLENLPR